MMKKKKHNEIGFGYPFFSKAKSNIINLREIPTELPKKEYVPDSIIKKYPIEHLQTLEIQKKNKLFSLYEREYNKYKQEEYYYQYGSCISECQDSSKPWRNFHNNHHFP